MAPCVARLFSMHKHWVLSTALHTVGVRGGACNTSTLEVEARKAEVQGHSQLHSEFKDSMDYTRHYLKEKKKSNYVI